MPTKSELRSPLGSSSDRTHPQSKLGRIPAVVLGALALATPAITLAQSPVLQRQYQEGETIRYKMQATNQGHIRNVRYEARAVASVKKNAAGVFVEEFAWSDVQVNDQPQTLEPASADFRETLSLAPGYSLSVPDLTQVQPILIGPIADLLAFYADVQLAMRQETLAKPGDHVSVKNGSLNSWADGTYVVLGQDAIDFEITLKSIDKKTAVVVVRHVPPAEPAIQFPADWMKAPVADTANNWLEVEKTGDKYAAEVGKETFEANITLDVATGRILSATMENPVEVLQRDCTDRVLTSCGDPIRYRIRRQITVTAEMVTGH